VVKGGQLAVKAALVRFRERFPKATIEAEDDQGTPFGYL
jgi:hypothetical protein